MKHVLTLIHHQLPQSPQKKKKNNNKNNTALQKTPKIRHGISWVTVVLNLEFLLLLRIEITVISLSEKVSVIKNSFYVQFKVFIKYKFICSLSEVIL